MASSPRARDQFTQHAFHSQTRNRDLNFCAGRREPPPRWHVEPATGHHPPPLVQGRYLGVVGDAAGYAHTFCLGGGRELDRHCSVAQTLRRCTDARHAAPPHKQAHRNGRNHMNWDRLEGNWKQFQGKVQQKWGKLTNDDLDVVKGKRTELAGRLQQRYGYARDEAEREIDTWLKSLQ